MLNLNQRGIIMKKSTYIRKLVTIFLLAILSFNLPALKASASVNEPTKTWNLSKKGTYKGSGSAKGTSLYSNYYFTGVSKMKFTVNNTGSSDITVNIYRKDGFFSYYRIKVEAYSTAIWNMNTDSQKKYEVKFSAPCKFNYSVAKG